MPGIFGQFSGDGSALPDYVQGMGYDGGDNPAAIQTLDTGLGTPASTGSPAPSSPPTPPPGPAMFAYGSTNGGNQGGGGSGSGTMIPDSMGGGSTTSASTGGETGGLNPFNTMSPGSQNAYSETQSAFDTGGDVGSVTDDSGGDDGTVAVTDPDDALAAVNAAFSTGEQQAQQSFSGGDSANGGNTQVAGLFDWANPVNKALTGQQVQPPQQGAAQGQPAGDGVIADPASGQSGQSGQAIPQDQIDAQALKDSPGTQPSPVTAAPFVPPQIPAHADGGNMDDPNQDPVAPVAFDDGGMVPNPETEGQGENSDATPGYEDNPQSDPKGYLLGGRGQGQGQGQGGHTPQENALMTYASGADALPPDQVQALEQRVDPQGQMSPAERRLYAVANAPQDMQHGMLQHYRKMQMLATSYAAQAAQGTQQKPADAHEFAKAATMAMQAVPNGNDVSFHALPSGKMLINNRKIASGGKQQPNQQGMAAGGAVKGYDDGGAVTDDTPEAAPDTSAPQAEAAGMIGDEGDQGQAGPQGASGDDTTGSIAAAPSGGQSDVTSTDTGTLPGGAPGPTHMPGGYSTMQDVLNYLKKGYNYLFKDPDPAKTMQSFKTSVSELPGPGGSAQNPQTVTPAPAGDVTPPDPNQWAQGGSDVPMPRTSPHRSEADQIQGQLDQTEGTAKTATDAGKVAGLQNKLHDLQGWKPVQTGSAAALADYDPKDVARANSLFPTANTYGQKIRYLDQMKQQRENNKNQQAGLQNKLTLAQNTGANRLAVQGLKNTGAEDTQGLKNTGATDVQGLKNTGATDVQGLKNTGATDVQGLKNTDRDRNVDAQDATRENVVGQQQTGANSRNANTVGGRVEVGQERNASQQDIENTRQQGANTRQDSKNATQVQTTGMKTDAAFKQAQYVQNQINARAGAKAAQGAIATYFGQHHGAKFTDPEVQKQINTGAAMAGIKPQDFINATIKHDPKTGQAFTLGPDGKTPIPVQMQ